MLHVLIADSGSTKTDWALGAQRFHTQGISPVHLSDGQIVGILREELLPQLRVDIGEIRFYGSGIRPEQEQRMTALLSSVFPSAGRITAKSDMLGAAIALCHHDEGQPCILGTGANSCLYDGSKILMNTPPLGYILGDEGSGAVLGREFLNALYKGRLYDGAREEFEQHFDTSLPDVISRVYRQPLANRWLASLSPFVHDHLAEPTVQGIVVDNFRRFIQRNILPYRRPDLPLSAVGSIAYYYQEQLREAASREGYAVGRILRSPIDGLVEVE